MARAATGSAHDQPSAALRTSPPSKAAESHAQSKVSRESARSVGDPNASAVRRLAIASAGITTSDRRGEHDADDGLVRLVLSEGEISDRLKDDVRGQHEEADRDQPESTTLAPLVVARTDLTAKLPHNHHRRHHLDHRVEPEANEGDRTGRDARADGDDGLDDVPRDGQPGEGKTSAAQKVRVQVDSDPTACRIQRRLRTSEYRVNDSRNRPRRRLPRGGNHVRTPHRALSGATGAGRGEHGTCG